MTSDEERELLARRSANEMKLSSVFQMAILLDLREALVLVTYLQVALRNPAAATGQSAIITKRIIATVVGQIDDAGYTATGELARRGDPG
jgi:hypothetical protein